MAISTSKAECQENIAPGRSLRMNPIVNEQINCTFITAFNRHCSNRMTCQSAIHWKMQTSLRKHVTQFPSINSWCRSRLHCVMRPNGWDMSALHVWNLWKLVGHLGDCGQSFTKPGSPVFPRWYFSAIYSPTFSIVRPKVMHLDGTCFPWVIVSMVIYMVQGRTLADLGGM